MKRGLGFIVFVFVCYVGIQGQTNPDDYWLNNGFVNGETVITNSGYFYDDGGNGDYNENQNWNVRFCSENGNPITVDFTDFSTYWSGGIPENDDYISINYPGADYIAYHDDTPEFGFTSQSGCINFGFRSDGDGNVHSGWIAEIYALPPPFNNDPADAEELIVGNTCSPAYYSNKGAFNSTGLDSPPCKEYFGGDVWFKLVVPANGTVKIETFAGTLTYAILDIYSSTDDNITDGERIACVDDGGAMPTVTLSAPTVSPGETIYIRLFGEQAKSGLFGICTSDPTAPLTGFVGPGGVGDSTSLVFWYKPETGVLNAVGTAAGNGEQVETWVDQSGNENDLIQSAAAFQPVYMQNMINSFGGLTFDGSNDIFELEGGSGSAPLHWFAAGSFVGSARQTMVSIGDGLINKTASISRHTDGRYFSFTSIDRYGPGLTDAQSYIFHGGHENTNPYHTLELDGLSQTVDNVANELESDGSLQVGASWDGSDAFNGNISELIQYSKSLNEAQKIIVNNYLSAKYNITLDANELYAWKSSYHHDVAGIGRVDMNNTHTKAQSAGVLSISGADDLDDDEYLFFGHDNGDFTTWSSANVPLGDTNIVRLDRVWRVDLIGAPGTVSMSFENSALPALPAGFVTYNIYVDSDGDFSNGATAYGPYEIGTELVVSNIAVNDGDYLAVAAVRPVLSFTSNVSEELESVANPSIEVSLNYAVSEIVTVDYIVSGGTAVQGTDYSLLSSSITINPGEKTGAIVPLILEDTIPEIPDEFFDIEISTSTPGITIGTYSSHRHTILNNDLGVEAFYLGDSIIGECVASTTQLRVEAKGNGPFTYAWSPGGSLDIADNDTVVASPATTTLYTVEVTDDFGQTVSDTIRVTVIPEPAAPLVTINGLASFCDGDSVNLSTVPGYAVYEWSTLETADNIWVKTSGSYNVKVTDTFGCESPVSADAVITVYPVPDPPEITVVGSTSFCDGDSVLLIAGSAYSSYEWSDLTANDTLIVKNSGDYFLTATSATGCGSDYSDTISVVVFSNPEKPAVTADGPTTFCADDSVQLIAPAGFADYVWSNAASTESIYVSTAGSYTVTVSDANGCSSEESDPVAVTVNSLPAAPVITPDGPTVFCDGGSVNLEPSGTYLTYIWSDAFSGQNRLIESSGEFAVMFLDGNGCESPYSDSITVTEHPAVSIPMVTATGLLEFCEGDSAILNAPAGYAAYRWSDGTTDDTLVVKASGSYDVYVTDANGCDSEISDAVDILVNLNPDAPVVTPIGPIIFCEGGSVDLDAGVGYTSYLWSDGGSTQNNNITVSGTYSLVAEDDKGCISDTSNKIDVVVNEVPAKPVVSPAGPIYLITGDDETLSAPLSDGYLWSPGGETSQDLLVTVSGEYSVIVENALGCTSEASDTVKVTVSDFIAPPEVSAAGPLEFCEGGDVILRGADGFTSYAWSDGSSGQEIRVSLSGTYTLIVTDAAGHTSFPSEDIVVEVFELPVLNLVSTTEPLCNGDTNAGAIVAATGGSPAYTYTWSSSGGNDDMLENVTAGTYSVTVQDQNGCEGDFELTIEQPEALAVLADINDTYCPDFVDGIIELTVEGGILPYSIVWEDGFTDEYYDNLAPGTYSYTVYDANSCEAEGSVEVTYLNPVCFEIPEVITPNGDPYNEFWLIEGLEVYPDVVIEVFDRWGKRVFYSEGHDTYFDGTYNGKELPMDSYHYVIDLNNGSERIIGNITILR